MTNIKGNARLNIVEAAARLLAEQGPSAVTTRGVAEAAGVQAPMIYRLFGDKDGLLEAVAEHVMATYVSNKAAVVAAATADGVDPLDDLRAGWKMQIDFGVLNPTLFSLLTDPVRALHSPALQSGGDVLKARVQRVAAAGLLRVSEQRAVDLIRAAGTGTVLTLLSTPPEERDPGLGDAMFEAVLNELLSSKAPRSSDTGPTTPAVTLRAQISQLDMLSEAEQSLMSEWLDRIVDGQP